MRFLYRDRAIDLRGWQAAIVGRSKNHWKDGRSAALLARAWLGAGAPGSPRIVAEAISTAFPNPSFTDGLVEHETSPPGKGGRSATDLLVLGHYHAGGLVIAVEGKVDEGFDHRLGCWVNRGASPGSLANRTRRWTTMASDLGLPASGLEWLPYQLLHRTWAALDEGRRRVADGAALLVHSFDGDRKSGWQDFVRFAKLCAPGQTVVPGLPLRVPMTGPPALWLIWVADRGGVPAPTTRCSACAALVDG